MSSLLLPALGGAFIGLAATVLLCTHGRVAGVSGMLGGALDSGEPDRRLRLAFLGGLVVAGLLARWVWPEAVTAGREASPAVLIAAGLLVGYGTRLGGGCTSGHGVCGVSRGSLRSVTATAIFITAGMVAVYIARRGGLS